MAKQSGIIGKTIGKCRILAPLGHGKTSSIFRARYEPLQKDVAVKILKEDMKASAEIREKFVNEARAIARLDHENIVKVIDVLEDRGYLLIIMELLKGWDCLELLEKDGPFEPGRAVDIVTEAARALEASHRQGIIHRDVKPANLMVVGRREQVKLLDFGLAAEGVTSGRAGTPAYMSPEQIRGKKVDEKSDIYSLGATLYHLLTGRPPYTGKTAKEMIDKHLEGKLPNPSRARLDWDVPKVLDPVVKRMMAPVAGYRPPARDLIVTLENMNLQARAVRHHRRAAKAASRRGSGPLIAAAAGTLVVIAVLLVLVFSGGDKPVRPDDTVPRAQTPSGEGAAGETNIINRANARKNREAISERDFNRAMSFLARNLGNYDLTVPKFEAIADEFPDTGAGEKARQQAKKLRGKRDATKIAAAKAARDKKKDKARAELEKKLEPYLKAYDFGRAREKLLEFFDEYRESKDLVRSYNRMKFAEELIVSVAEELALSGKKYPVSLFKRGYADSARIKTATPEGLVIVDDGLEKNVTWSFFTPQEIGKLAGRLFRMTDTKRYFYLHAFYYELDAEKDAAEALDTAKGLDKFGLVKKLQDEIEKRPK